MLLSASTCTVDSIDHYTALLRQLLTKVMAKAETPSSLKEQFKALFKNQYPLGLQLPQAYLSLISYLLGIMPRQLQPQQNLNGSILLDTLGLCQPKEVPEPTELAELGALWMVQGACLKDELVQRAGLKLAMWQEYLFDPHGKPHFSAWSRASVFNRNAFYAWHAVLFKMAFLMTQEVRFNRLSSLCQMELEKPDLLSSNLLSFFESNVSSFFTPPSRPFAEEMSLGMIKYVSSELSLMAQITGWNSGLFSVHKKEVAIVNAGPAVGSYDHLTTFGVERTCRCDRHSFQDMTWEKSAYHCYLKGWTRIQNEAFWLEFSTRYQAGESRFEIQLQEKSNLNSIYMLLFLKGSRVTVAGKYQLGASSLDKYEGKASSLELQDSREKMMLYPNSGMRMQVIPLARVDEFWKSDFLVAFSLNQENPRWTLQVR